MKRLFTVIFLLAASSSFAQTGGAWTQKADLSTTNRESAVGFSINTKGYIGLGIVGGGVNGALWEYDYTTNLWTQKASMSGGGRVNPVAVVISGNAYVGTGEDNMFNLDKKWYQYNPLTNVWTAKTDFGGTGRTEAVAFAIGTKAYVGTGYDGARRKDFWEYDATGNTWTQKADFGGTARQRAIGFAIGTKGYIGTGNDGARKKDFWEYDQATNTWTQKKDFAGAARESAVAFVINSKGYIATGDAGTGKNDIWEYTPAADEWTQRANFTGQRRYVAAGFANAINNKGYIGTGFTDEPSVGVSVRDFYEFTPAVPPAAPTDLMVTQFSETSIRLNWLDRSSDETGFVVERSTNGTTFATVATLAAGSAKYTDNGLSTGIQYYYRVRSTKTSDGASAASNVASQITGINHNGVWTTLSSSSNTNPSFEYGTATFTLNGIAYLTGSGQLAGIPYATSNQLWAYDPATATFTQKAQFPGVSRTKSMSFALNGKGYVGGGQTSSGSTNSVKDFWQYDPATNAWVQKADLGTAGRFGAFVFTLGNKAYVGGGTIATTGLNVKDFYEYDPTADTWTPRADFPTIATGLHGVGYNNKGYVVYPYTFPIPMYEFDPAGNTWTAKANFPINSYGFRSMLVLKDRLFATTYDFESTSSSTLWEYEMTNSRWIERAVHFVGSQYSSANAANTNDLLFLFYQTSLYEYNPDFDLRAPSAINAEIVDPTKVKITWTLDATATTTQIYRAESEAGPFTLVTELPRDKTVYIDELEVGDKTFYYEMRAANGALVSAYTKPVKATKRGAWKQLKNMGTNMDMFGDMAVATSTRGYIGVNFYSQTWWEFNPENETWTQKANFPGEVRSSGVAFAINDQIYAGFGLIYDQTAKRNRGFNEFYNYNPATNTWTRKADFPGTRRTGPSSASGNGKGYILGGDDDAGGATSFLKDAWEYNPANDSWTQLPDMPVGTAYMASFVHDGQLHFMNGGIKSSASSWSGVNQWYILDLTNATWTKAAATQYGASGTPMLINDEVYFSPAGMFSYNFTSKQWVLKPAIPQGTVNGIRSFMLNGKIYGVNNKYEVWVYNPDATVAQPEKLTSVFQGDRIILSWQNGSTLPVKTEIQSLDSWGQYEYIPLATTALGATQYVFLNLTADKNYRFRAVSILENGERSIPSNTTFENSGPYWTQIGTVPFASRQGAISFIANTKLYYGTGVAGSVYFKDMWEYDLTTGTWTQKADFPGEGRSTATTFTLGADTYVGFGGGASASSLKDLYKYSPATNAWAASINYPNNSSVVSPGVFVEGNSAYLLGGVKNGSSSTNEVWRFDGLTWTQMTSWPGEIRRDPMIFAMNGKAYISAGTKYVSGTTSYAGDDFWEYTIASDTWKALKDLPDNVGSQNRSYSFPGSNAALSFVTPNGGSVGVGIQARVYTPGTDTWSYLGNPLTFDFLAGGFTAVQDPATGLTYVVVSSSEGLKLWRYEYQLNGPNLVEVKVATPGTAKLKWRKMTPQPDSVVIYRSGTYNVLGTRQSSVKSADTTAMNNISTGQTYYYTIRAYSNSGQYKTSAPRVLVVDSYPAAPIELTGELIDDEIRLSWKAGNGPIVTSYLIERAIGNGVNFSSIGTTPSTEFVSSDFAAATMSYRVRASNASGESGYSNVVTIMVTGIEEEKSVGVYPNPTSDYLTIEVNSQDGPVNMQILDYSGRKMYANTLTATTRVDVSSYSAGIYFVNLVSTKRASNKYIKIIKK